MKKLGAIILVAVVAVLTMQVGVYATPSIGNPHQEWAGSDTEGWTADPLSDNDIAVSHNAGGYLQISVTGSGPIPGYGRTITTGAVGTDYFSGDYAAIGAGVNGSYELRINFDFLTTGSTPGELGLYFRSGSGHIWAYDVAGLEGSPVANGLTTYAVTAGTAGWIAQNGGWTVADLVSDWASVSWLGLYIQGSSGPTEIYGLDNMYLNFVVVPEPETVWMLLAVVMSIGITFRSRLVDTMTQMKTRFTKV